MTLATDLEIKVLTAVLHNYFHDGAQDFDKINGYVWSNCINDSDKPSGIEGKQLSGVVASLCRKKLLNSDGECVALTKEGYDIAKAVEQ